MRKKLFPDVFWEVCTAQQLFANPQPTGAGSSRFTASLMGPVFTITPSLFLVLCKEMPSKMYDKVSRVFTRGFISGMYKLERCDAIFYFGFYFFVVVEVSLMPNPLFCLVLTCKLLLQLRQGCIGLLSHWSLFSAVYVLFVSAWLTLEVL